MKAAGHHVRPARTEDLTWISSLQQKLYSPLDAVPLTILQEWFAANPNGFFIVCNALHEPVGQITFLPIKTGTMELYQKEGNQGLIETEIGGASLYSPAEAHEVSDLYLESIILPAEDRRNALQVLMQVMPEIIFNVRKSESQGHLFALAATTAGERWLEKMGFTKISRAEARRDAHNMYCAALANFLQRSKNPDKPSFYPKSSP